jgi:hypothetical protein
VSAGNTRAEDAWAVAMLLGALAIVAALVALPLFFLFGRGAAFTALWIAVGLVVVSAPFDVVFLRAWSR